MALIFKTGEIGNDLNFHAIPLWLLEVKKPPDEQFQDVNLPHEKQTIMIHLYSAVFLTDLVSKLNTVSFELEVQFSFTFHCKKENS